MLPHIKHKIKDVLHLNNDKLSSAIDAYIKNGRVPWSYGYNQYKWQQIEENISNEDFLRKVLNHQEIKNYGVGIDERIIEYPWIFANLRKEELRILDAGSTFNYEPIINHPTIKIKQLTILTYYPESKCFWDKNISYVFDDLRTMPFRNNLFDEIVCQSTIEHIDMDNSIYGYKNKTPIDLSGKKNFEYLKAVNELIRILKPEGQLLLTFPYGKFENHGFFQQFDRDMLMRLLNILDGNGKSFRTFYNYFKEGWQNVEQVECDDSESFNPHTGKGKKNDGAAHCRSICCIKFIKY